MWERIAKIKHTIVAEPEDFWCESCKHNSKFDSCLDCRDYDHYEMGEKMKTDKQLLEEKWVIASADEYTAKADSD